MKEASREQSSTDNGWTIAMPPPCGFVKAWHSSNGSSPPGFSFIASGNYTSFHTERGEHIRSGHSRNTLWAAFGLELCVYCSHFWKSLRRCSSDIPASRETIKSANLRAYSARHSTTSLFPFRNSSSAKLGFDAVADCFCPDLKRPSSYCHSRMRAGLEIEAVRKALGES